MDFVTLKSRILALIGRAPADICYELVTADINHGIRLRVMETTATLVESATVALPDDFLQLISLYRDVSPRTTLNPIPPQALHDGFTSSGQPAFYSIENGQLRLSPSPNGSAGLADITADYAPTYAPFIGSVTLIDNNRQLITSVIFTS